MSASRHAVSAVVGLERGATALLLHQEENAAFVFVGELLFQVADGARS